MIMHEKDIKFVHELLDTPSYICRGGGVGTVILLKTWILIGNDPLLIDSYSSLLYFPTMLHRRCTCTMVPDEFGPILGPHWTRNQAMFIKPALNTP